MPTTIIGATLQIDAGNSNANIKEVNQNLDQTQKVLASTTDSAKDSGAAFGNLKSQMSALPGPLGEATEGVNSLSESFKAMLANPVVLVITAIVGALAFLYKSFTNTKEGGDQMEATFAGIKAAAGAVLDAIFALGGAIIKFFKGDFSGAFDDAKKAITGVVGAVVDAYGQASTLTAKLQELHKQQLANDLESATRAAELAKLREQSTDETIPIAKRKEALEQLQALSKDAAAKDVALAQETANTKNKILSIGTDAAKKNQDEITKNTIDAINTRTEAENEQRRIGKQIQVADKQEKAEAKAAADAARAASKKDREELEAFNTQLNKLHQQNALAGITDQYAKEKQLLENKISDEAALIAKQFADGKITRDQYNQLNIAQLENAQIQRAALTAKHQQDIADNEQKFQAQLADIRGKTAADGIVNQAQKEQVQLEISHQKELAQAIKDYGSDADKLFQIKQALDAEYAAKQEALDAKNKAAAEKKKLDDAKKHAAAALKDPNNSPKAKQAALDAEQKQFKQAFDNKVITEEQYNDEVSALAEARKKIHDDELQQIYKYADAASTTFDNLAEIAGKQTAAGKAFSIAAATISAISGAVKSFEAMASIPIVGPALGFVAAAAALVAGYENVKKIVAVDVPGQSTGSASLPSISIPTAPVAPSTQQTSTTLNQASINQLGQAQSNVRAYVVESDLASTVNRAARLSNSATLGGN